MVFKVVGNEVYEAIKAELLCGAYPQGSKIDIAQMAEALHSSATPVRESLMRLVGEQLVQAVPHAGFFIPRTTDTKLRRLVDWSQYQLMPAIRAAGRREPMPSIALTLLGDADPILKLEHIFVAIAGLEGNPEVRVSMARTNDRLRIPRQAASSTRDERDAEVEQMASCLSGCDFPRLATLVTSHHDTIRLDIPRIVERLETDTGMM